MTQPTEKCLIIPTAREIDFKRVLIAQGLIKTAVRTKLSPFTLKFEITLTQAQDVVLNAALAAAGFTF